MQNLKLDVLDENAYHRGLTRYYDYVRDYLISSLKKRKGKGKDKGKGNVLQTHNCYSVSPELGLQLFITVKEGQINVKELRVPIFIDGSLWVRNIEQFINRLQLTYQFSLISNKLLKMTSSSNNNIIRCLITLAKTNPEMTRVKFSDLRALTGQTFGLSQEDVVVDIYSWNSEDSILELVVELTSSGSLTVQEDQIRNIIDQVYQQVDIRRVSLNREVSVVSPSQGEAATSSSGEAATSSSGEAAQTYRILQQLNSKIYRLLSAIKQELVSNKRDDNKIVELEYQNDIADLKINNYLHLLREGQRGEQAKGDREHLFNELGKQLTFTKDDYIGSQVEIKGKQGVIVSQSSGQFRVRLEGRTIKISQSEVTIIPSLQQQLYDEQRLPTNNYLNVTTLLKNYPDIEFNTLVSDIYRDLIALKIPVRKRYVEKVFTLSLGQGYYLADSHQPSPHHLQYGGLSKREVEDRIRDAKTSGQIAMFKLLLPGKKSAIAKTLRELGLGIVGDHLVSSDSSTNYENKWELFTNPQGTWQARLITGDVMTHQYIFELGTRFDMVKGFLYNSAEGKNPSGSSQTEPIIDKFNKKSMNHSEHSPDKPNIGVEKKPLQIESGSDSDEAEEKVEEQPIARQSRIDITNRQDVFLTRGPVTDIDLRNRPYLLDYDISDYHNINTKIMGCLQSKQVTQSSHPRSSRPNRQGGKSTGGPTEGTKKRLTQQDSMVFLDFTNYKSIGMEITKQFIVQDNSYDQSSRLDSIDTDNDTIIITDDPGELGFVANETIGELETYRNLSSHLNWRNLLLPSNSLETFHLDGQEWSSINGYIYFTAISPILTIGYEDISENNFSEYQNIFYKGLKLNGNLSLSQLRTTYSFNLPSYWGQTLNELLKNQREWLFRVTTQLGLEIQPILDRYGHLTLQNFMLKRAYYAKFSQVQVLTNIILDTRNARLLNRQPHQSIYEPNNALMETRAYLANQTPPVLYNIERDQSLRQVTIFKKQIVTGIKRWIRERKSIPSEDELRVEYTYILSDGCPEALVAQYTQELPTVLENNQLYFRRILVESGSAKPSKNPFNSLVKDNYLLQISDIKDSSEGKREDQGDMINWGLVFSGPDNFKNFTEIRINALNEYLKADNLICYDVPGDGDCMFHSLVDNLSYHGFIPLNKDREEKYDLSTVIQDISISLGGNPISISVHREAVNEARRDISDKIRANKNSIYILEESGITMTVGEAVTLEYQELSNQNKDNSIGKSEADEKPDEIADGSEDKFNKYLEVLSISARGDLLSKGKQNGIWGSDLEIWAAAALYNVNIRVFVLNTDGTLRNQEGNLYTSQDAVIKFPEGIRYSQQNFQGELKIAWLPLQGLSAHYITLRNLETCKGFMVDRLGRVKKEVTPGVVYQVGDDFNAETGIFQLREQPEQILEKTSHDDSFCYFTQLSDTDPFPKDIYYFGRLVGKESTNFAGIQFNL